MEWGEWGGGWGVGGWGGGWGWGGGGGWVGGWGVGGGGGGWVGVGGVDRSWPYGGASQKLLTQQNAVIEKCGVKKPVIFQDTTHWTRT